MRPRPRQAKNPLKDPLYRQILDGLAGKLDPDSFELCATALLKEVWPTIAPVPGGSDGGRDGVVSDDGPFLVCTTSDQVGRNMRTSLKSHTRKGRKSRRFIIATSAAVTPQQRDTLEQDAADEGYQLLNVYQRVWFAHALHGDRFWRKELLDITGSVPVLSAVPLGRRLQASELVGRDTEIQRIRGLKTDVVVVGEPGTGKTAVLQKLVETGALFVADPDIDKIADACRELKPTIVIVDDAALLPSFGTEFLARLKHMRTQIDADFRIAAATWPTEANLVADALELSGRDVVTIERLSRDQMVALLGRLGLKGPTPLVRLVVDQAEGLAGLGTFLADAILSGKADTVFTGEALAERTYSTMERLLGKEARSVLGLLALGGDFGIASDKAAELLRMSVPDYFARVTALASGGIIRETGQDYQRMHAVFPRVLRWVLVRDVFFKGPPPIAYEKAISALPYPKEATKVLVGAHSRGAYVPDLQQRVVEADSEEIWKAYAWSGRSECLFALKNNADALKHIVEPALHNAPDVILPRLLDAASEDFRELSQHPDHPLRRIESWTKTLNFDGTDIVRRREQVIRATEGWDNRGQPARASVALGAVLHALNPAVEGSETDPGSGNTLTVTNGQLRVRGLTQLADLWSRALKIIVSQPWTCWKPVFDLIRSWIVGPAFGVSETTDSVEFRASMVARMLRELAAASADRPGLQHELKAIAERRSMSLEVTLDPEYEEVYPKWSLDLSEMRAVRESSARAFASRYVGKAPSELAKRLIELEKEAKIADHGWPHVAADACAVIAEEVSEPWAWFDELRAAGCASGCAEPFLRVGASRLSGSTESRLAQCLEEPQFRGAAIWVVLVGSQWPEALVIHAIEKAPSHPEVIYQLSMVGRLSTVVLDRLLQLPDERVRKAVVEGHWYHLGDEELDESLRTSWRSAILRMTDGSHVLPEILQADSELGEAWIAARLEASKTTYLAHDVTSVLENIAAGLPAQARQRLLSRLSVDASFPSSVPAALLGDELSTYQEFLANSDMKDHHLGVLEGMPNDRWLERAGAALQAGYAANEVAEASFDGGHSWRGSEAEYWRSWQKSFDDLKSKADEACLAILLEGSRIAAERVERARKREKLEQTYNRRW